MCIVFSLLTNLYKFFLGGDNTPKPEGKGDEKLPSAAVTDVPKSGDTGKPTPKPQGTILALPFAGSGGSTKFGSGVVGVGSGVGGGDVDIGGGDGGIKLKHRSAKTTVANTTAASKTQHTSNDDAAVSADSKASGGEVAVGGGDGSAKASDGGQKFADNADLTKQQQKDVKIARGMKKALASALGQDDQFKTQFLTKEDCLLGDMGHAKVLDKAILRAKNGLDVFAKHHFIITESDMTDAAQQEQKCILAKEVGWYFFYDHFMNDEEDAKTWLGVTEDDVFRNQVIDNYWEYIDVGRKERAAYETSKKSE